MTVCGAARSGACSVTVCQLAIALAEIVFPVGVPAHRKRILDEKIKIAAHVELGALIRMKGHGWDP